LKATGQNGYGSSGLKNRRVVATRHGGPDVLQMVAAGRLKPVVAERVPLRQSARAHELLERGRYGGKAVLVTSA